ncbi:phosphatidylinositol-specific phospholipase C domain-containing protein [Tahibacter amnicola]|uniref:1-phosphatidylinositol phosphodiesterase n=1 Tax=Tahibacter amnicola TaxID=2976241 RepID=A0ABY6BNM1_9GAMM|nr:phosphatidylinositol-specific phospholipase C domain-containing protein [Tahibacter amnicola]UXI70166.1 phosphatidylinositol-specific phospholipase C domain-containing protein [Tahibacter amnicola]
MERRISNNRINTLAMALAALLPCTGAFAHDHSAYSHDSGNSRSNSEWMANVADKRLLRDMSLPGTHDTMTYDLDNYDSAQTQAKSLAQQLAAGVRVLDIRCRRINNRFHIYHGFVTTHFNFDDVLLTVTDFLADHPSETVLMRIKPEGNESSTMSFEDVFDTYVDDSRYTNYFWRGTSTGVTLGDVRGKIVVLANFENAPFGISYGSINIQDNYQLDTNWDLYGKWVDVKEQIQAANTSSEGSRSFYMNYLSGSGGSFPYFVASGHSSPGTSAPRLLTGLTTPGWKDKYPDFPRIDCFLGVCSIAFEGTNVLAYDYLEDKNIAFSGILMADFPGHGLIDRIVALNNDAVTLFQNTNYSGTRKSVELGSHTLASLAVGDNMLSSVSLADNLTVTLYDNSDLSGSYTVISSDTAALSSYGFDNRASSITVMPKGAAVYEHGSYTGRMQILPVGSYNLSDLNLGNDVISSIRVGDGYKVKLYEHSNFKGDTKTLTSDASGLGSFNDETSSIVVSYE